MPTDGAAKRSEGCCVDASVAARLQKRGYRTRAGSPRPSDATVSRRSGLVPFQGL